ncbi:MAG: acetyl-CoA carboxylase biotin carboxyl carrier protein [Saprospiraceae bacterium]|nr:acetyl-CoA carboxylase biotin carboxyl carrier protein [Saprospiraceae bacterium]MCF8250857.1 acetyl-CoA carboxylase biotin carboxyl carrier protein [Saprospiraceae bacterium]MCF8280684.1 acetyl-CoA carboxylase biotin carboxyl carrier protein [Bacteroidales bacterium]MCF8312742.1 acetyl-CoA carboxylase biotin carboxyl carrier protein [Saprospiraceae bacterium]MCF8441189.1 acetyl-CoA carboxylase biotin carboxyl carrier protein [Saprospiraceae bacterium]
MTFQEIQELIKLLNKSNLAEFKMEDNDFKLSIRTALYAETKSTQLISAPMPLAPPPAGSPAPASAVPTAPAPAATPAEKPAGTAPKAEPAAAQGYLEIKSPMVGTFYRSANPEKPSYAEIGQKVKKGDVVCIIEAMKLFNEIESEVSGTIVKAMIDNAQPVEYDQVLFLVEPD